MKHRIHGFLPEIQEFERHLLSVRRSNGQLRFTKRTAHTYAVAVNGALARKLDPVAVLAEHEPTSRWNVLRSAFLAWADWRHDTPLAERLRAVQAPPINFRETKPPTPEEWDRIIGVTAALPEPHRSVLLLLMTSGLRIGEVFLLSRTQVRLGITNREIVIAQKGTRIRDWTPSAKDRILLGTLSATEGWRVLRDVFDRYAGRTDLTEQQHYDAAYYAVWKILQAICTSAGVEYVRPHRYRHAVAGDLVDAGANIIDVQHALGHADSRTTDKHYLHSAAERQADLKDRAASKHSRPF